MPDQHVRRRYRQAGCTLRGAARQVGQAGRLLEQVGHRDRLPGEQARRLLPDPFHRAVEPGEAGRAVRAQRPLAGDVHAVRHGQVIEPIGQRPALAGQLGG
jgi:hypothetical protein